MFKNYLLLFRSKQLSMHSVPSAWLTAFVLNGINISTPSKPFWTQMAVMPRLWPEAVIPEVLIRVETHPVRIATKTNVRWPLKIIKKFVPVTLHAWTNVKDTSVYAMLVITRQTDNVYQPNQQQTILPIHLIQRRLQTT